jgi:hypothetical protein
MPVAHGLVCQRLEERQHLQEVVYGVPALHTTASTEQLHICLARGNCRGGTILDHQCWVATSQPDG